MSKPTPPHTSSPTPAQPSPPMISPNVLTSSRPAAAPEDATGTGVT